MQKAFAEHQGTCMKSDMGSVWILAVSVTMTECRVHRMQSQAEARPALNGRENLSESGQIVNHRMWSDVSHRQD